jgi:NADH-quinone oxidoreductase subunit N
MPAYVLEISTLVLGLFLLLLEAWTPAGSKQRIAHLGIVGLAVVFAMLVFGVKSGQGDTAFYKFYATDSISLFYKGLALLTTIVVLVLSVEYRPILEKFSARAGGGPAVGEYYALPIFICTGLMWMASAIDITSIFVSLELVTIAFYVQVAYMRRNVGSLEAGVKYLILGALSTGFFVFGLSWLFGVTGRTGLSEISEALQHTTDKAPALFALALIAVGLAFKVAAVPFQMWVPDVYQGAPTPTTAYLSVGSKSAGFIVAHRLLTPFLDSQTLGATTTSLIVTLAGITLLVGNLAAIPQRNFKRLLAYSSIAHAGFLLLALACHGKNGSPSSIQAISYYLASYLVMTMLAFAVMIVVGKSTGSDDLTAYDGLGKRSPLLAFALTLALASLAGVPLTAGFLGKFFVFQLAVTAKQTLAVALGVIGAVAGFYYYFKVIKHMYFGTASVEASEIQPIAMAPMTKALIIVLMVAVVGLFFGAGLIGLLK